MVAPALLMILFGLPLAAAAVPLAPPVDLAATMTPNGVELTWEPPAGSTGGVTYAVYRDGTLLDGAVEGLSYVDATSLASSSMTGTTVYSVTAITVFGESLPAVVPTGCIHTDFSTPPFVFIDPSSCVP